MRRLLGLLACSVALSAAVPCRAQTPLPLGTVAAAIDCTPARILADPVRQRVFVADSVANKLLVIDTPTLQVTATIPVGFNPVDLAISPDGGTLYVANAGSATAAISVVDLDTLAVRATLALPGTPRAIAAGLEGRVYASVDTADYQNNIYQFDGATGAVQFTFIHNIDNRFGYDCLQTTPDGKTLLVAGDGDVASYDVSAAVPAALQIRFGFGQGSATPLVISHNGKSSCWPGVIDGLLAGNYDYTTGVVPTNDIEASYGVFDDGFFGGGTGPLAFSPDDLSVYEISGSSADGESTNVRIFDTASFAQTGIFSFPAGQLVDKEDWASSVVTDRTGSYLFIGETAVPRGTDEYVPTAGRLLVLATGAGTLTLPLPTITVARTVVGAAGGTGQVGEFIFSLSCPAPADTEVAYKINGTANNGIDYTELRGTVKIKAGRMSKAIKVVPLGFPGGYEGAPPGTTIKKTVVLALTPGVGYAVGAASKTKLKILFVVQ